MKKIILACLLFLSGFISAQNPTIFYKEGIDKGIRFFNGPDTVTTLIRYDVAIVLNVPDTSLVNFFRCDFFKRVNHDGILSDSIITTLNINVKNIPTSAYNEFNSTNYFMESKKIYFVMKNLDILPTRSIKVSAYNMESVVIKNETYNLDF